VSRDPLDQRMRDLFEAGRREPAPEATRARIAAALRTRSNEAVQATSTRTHWPVVRIALAVAAAALAAGMVSLVGEDPPVVRITAEAPRPPTPKASSEESTLAPAPAPAPPGPSASVRPAPAPAPRADKRPAAPAPPSLDDELGSMQRARSALSRGDATGALAELDRFAKGPGWRQLAVEASLLRIEALARAGRNDEARNLARRFVERHPNNPLVDRARTFASPPAPSASFEPTSGEKP